MPRTHLLSVLNDAARLKCSELRSGVVPRIWFRGA